MAIQVNTAFIKKYLVDNVKGASYAQALDITEHLRFHFDGFEENVRNHQAENPYFAKLIDERRPGEPLHIKDYRRKIYVSKTKQPCFKVLNSLKKIVKAEDWKIDHSKVETPPRIIEDETLERYTKEYYPIFGSVESWAYNVAIKDMLRDPNAAVVVMPLTYNVEANEYLKPYSHIIPSKRVLDYVQGEFIVFISDETYTWKDKKGGIHKDQYIYAMDEATTWRIEKKDQDSFTITVMQEHNIGKLPAWRIGGVIKEVIDNTILFESFINPMLPSLDSAAREWSDLDAEVVQNIFSTMWYIAGQECKTCKGTGSVSKAGGQSTCGACEGEGTLLKSPYKDIVVKKQSLDDANTPIPPAGYVQKDTTIVTVQDTRIKNHIIEALASLNMEFLADTPLNQSGTAKEVDRDELNNFVYGVAQWLVTGVIEPVYKFIAAYRYTGVLGEDAVKALRAMQPAITIPERYDLLSQDVLISQLAKAKDAGIDSTIISELQTDFINKRFKEQPDVRKKIVLVQKLNPFNSLDPEAVSNLALTGQITKEDAILAIYINAFIEEAILDDRDFLDREISEQRAIIKAKAVEKAKANSAAGRVAAEMETNEDENDDLENARQ